MKSEDMRNKVHNAQASLPCVTNLLDLLNKPALLKWANKVGLEGKNLDDIRKKAFANGTNIHRQIENYIKEAIPFEDEKVQKRFDQLFSDKTILGSEVNIETDYFIGRYDVKIEFEGNTYICDFKTSKGVWFENILQLIAYRMAEPVDGIAVISVPSFRIRFIDIHDYGVYERILKNLSEIYFLKNKIAPINPYY